MGKKQYACGTYRPEPKYHDKKRKSPPYSATDCEGRVMVGNDGNDWIAELSGKSVRWVKLESSKSKRKSPVRKSRRKSTRKSRRKSQRKSPAPKSKRKSAARKSRRKSPARKRSKSQRKSKPRGGNKKKSTKKK